MWATSNEFSDLRCKAAVYRARKWIEVRHKGMRGRLVGVNHGRMVVTISTAILMLLACTYLSMPETGVARTGKICGTPGGVEKRAAAAFWSHCCPSQA